MMMYSSNNNSNNRTSVFAAAAASVILLLLGGLNVNVVHHHDTNNAAGLVVGVSAKSSDFLPRKNWATIGYESFFGKRPEKGAVAKSRSAGKKKVVPKPPPSPPSPTTTTKSVSNKKKKTKKGRGSSDSDAPNPVTKAVLGVAVAATAAAIGGKALSSGDNMRPELALVESLRKPIVARNVPPPRSLSIKTAEDGATIPNEVFNLGTFGLDIIDCCLEPNNRLYHVSWLIHR